MAELNGDVIGQLPTIETTQRQAATGTLDSNPQLNPRQLGHETAQSGAKQRDGRGSKGIGVDSRNSNKAQQKAGEGSRTLNNQLGRLEGTYSNSLEKQLDTDSHSTEVPKTVPSEHDDAPPPPHPDRLDVIANLLVDLPETSKEVILAAIRAAIGGKE